jgi:hypothetical protein
MGYSHFELNTKYIPYLIAVQNKSILSFDI